MLYIAFLATKFAIYSDFSTKFIYIEDGEIMDIQSINDDIKTKQWVERIKACRESGLPVRKWCKQNNICEQTYYCWLKKLRKMAIETGAVQAPSFVPIDQSLLDKQNIIITKGDVRIEFPCDTDIGTVTNIIGALLC